MLNAADGLWAPFGNQFAVVNLKHLSDLGVFLQEALFGSPIQGPFWISVCLLVYGDNSSFDDLDQKNNQHKWSQVITEMMNKWRQSTRLNLMRITARTTQKGRLYIVERLLETSEEIPDFMSSKQPILTVLQNILLFASN